MVDGDLACPEHGVVRGHCRHSGDVRVPCNYVGDNAYCKGFCGVDARLCKILF